LNYATFCIHTFSKTRDRYHIGSCADIDARLKRHNDGATISTKNGRPWEIKYFEKFDSKTEALKRENYLKRMKSRVLIKNLKAATNLVELLLNKRNWLIQ
jgi:putative endonuclease